MDVIEQLGTLGVIPVVTIEDAARATRLAEALTRGGLPCAEITFRTAAAAEAIKRIATLQPFVLVGAGTVLNVKQAEQAAEAGARFIVSPGFNPKMVDWCLGNQMPVIPGIATPSEAMVALERGLKVLKFFPAEALGGIPMLKAISAALVGVKFVPTGGVSAENLETWLKQPFVHAAAGSWLATPGTITSGAFTQIEQVAAEAVALVRKARAVEAAV